jgi:N-acetylglucosamine-6-phosphate deacetylase
MLILVKAFINAEVNSGGEIITGLAMLVDRGKVVGYEPVASLRDSVEVTDLEGARLVPGYVDLQVNGGGGVLFNEVPTMDGIVSILEAHRRLGTTSILPTFITGSQEAMESAITVVREAISYRMPGLLGIHLEGPVINPERAGVHNPRLIRWLDAEWLAGHLQGIPSLITLAPEMTGPAYVRMLVARGIRVAIGHSNATGEEADLAVDAGASLVTHLYNSCSQLTGDDPGVVGTALARPELAVSCIADGHHVAFRSLEAAVRAKGPGGFLLVTDAMPVVGSSRTDFMLEGTRISLHNGRCETDDGIRAGSALTMAAAVRNCARRMGVPEDEAVRMGGKYPAAYFGVGRSAGSLLAGSWADALVLDAALNVLQIMFRGDIITPNRSSGPEPRDPEDRSMRG